MTRALVLLVFGFFLLGCVTSAPSNGPTASPTSLVSATPIPTQDDAGPTPYASVYPSYEPAPAYDAPPWISGSSARPSNPDRGEPFVITASAQDDVGIQTISWESTDSFSIQPESASFDCGQQKSCSASFTFKAATEGMITISVYATDSSGKASPRSAMDITVRPFDYKEPTPTPAPSVSSGPVCGNNACDEKEGFEVCPVDCPYAGFACANGKCEGGESYESCPQDCGLSDIIGSSCGDGACEPGEDANYCPKDCASIKPNCGNNVCDAWETESTCLADCEGVGADAASCSSNAACGYREICRSGKCVKVDCTNDGQCGYGKECEGNRCVRCPSGPYGPAC
ncbi:hypothetical protein HY572_03425 [Candidatus Micrarchaeota archaeon]|nr:hypothetical protein [Candidatus Micrarchaeota archaeon]